MRLLILLLCFFAITSVQATILPPNNLHLEDDINRFDANIDEAEFNRIIDEIVNIYKPIVAGHGATLEARKLWTNSTVNASAQRNGDRWIINMYGGLARRPETTPDGFALVVCHELGHHLAGFPFKGGRWAANEGQSDYFASQSCARQIWKDQPQKNSFFSDSVHPLAKGKCDSKWSAERDRNICYRSAMAGLSLARLLGSLRNQVPQFETPSASVVARTSDSHPPAQCRLDTYLSGALCTQEFDPHLIPGRSHADGQGSRAAELVAAKHSCTRAAFFDESARRLCWYKPQVMSLMEVTDVRMAEVKGNRDTVKQPGEGFSVLSKLSNTASVAYENISVKLKPMSGALKSDSGEIQLAKLEPGETLHIDPMSFSISSEAKCGHNAGFEIEVGIGRRVPVFRKEFMVGRIKLGEGFQQNEVIEIPDRDWRGINSEMTIGNQPEAFTAAVSVDITHPQQRDIQIRLTSPDRKHYYLKRTGGNGADVKATYEVKLRSKEVAGKWTLNVRDTYSGDTGQLNHWKIQFGHGSCH